MKKIVLVYAIAAFIACSCTGMQEAPEISGVPMVLTAYQEGTPDTKTAVEDGGKQVFWEPGDEIKVFSGSRTGRFTASAEQLEAVTTFTGHLEGTAPDVQDIWAVYPYSEEASFDGECITTVIPSVQTARPGTFAQGANVAIAHSTTTNLQFYNVGGGIRFSLTEEGISRVILSGLNGESIAGTIRVYLNNDNLPEISSVSNASTSISLCAPEGDSFRKGVWYYFTTIPGMLKEGLSITFYKDDKYTFLTSSEKILFKRKVFYSISDADRGLEYNDVINESEIQHISDVIESCSMEEGGVSIALEQRREEIISNPAVESLSISEGNASVLFKNGKMIQYLLDTDSVFDETKPASKAKTKSGRYPATRSSTVGNVNNLKTATVIIFNLFSEVEDRAVQNSLVDSAVGAFKSKYGEEGVCYCGFNEFSSFNLSTALQSQNCKFLFIFSHGTDNATGDFIDKYASIMGRYEHEDLSGKHLAIGEYHLDPNDRRPSIYADNCYYKTISIDELFEDDTSCGITTPKLIYFGSCFTLSRNFNLNNACVLGWTGKNKVGQAYGLMLAEYFALYGKNLTAFWSDFAIDGVIADPIHNNSQLITKGNSAILTNPSNDIFPSVSWDRIESKGFVESREVFYIATPSTGHCVKKAKSLDVKTALTISGIVSPAIVRDEYKDRLSIEAKAYGFEFIKDDPDDNPWGSSSGYSSDTNKYPVEFKLNPLSVGLKKSTIDGVQSGVIKITSFLDVDSGKLPTDVCYVLISKEFQANDAYIEDEEDNTYTYPTPEAVDLGLSVKWASFNLGASKPEEYGDYFAWGETEPYYEPGYAQSDNPVWKAGKEAGYNLNSYKWCYGNDTSFIKYCSNSDYGVVDNRDELELSDDAAHVQLGGKWRMPTLSEFEALRDSCSWEQENRNGITVFKVTSKVKGYTNKSIYLPFSGMRSNAFLYLVGSMGTYWSSTMKDPYLPVSASCIYWNSGNVLCGHSSRDIGNNIRPVCPKD